MPARTYRNFNEVPVGDLFKTENDEVFVKMNEKTENNAVLILDNDGEYPARSEYETLSFEGMVQNVDADEEVQNPVDEEDRRAALQGCCDRQQEMEMEREFLRRLLGSGIDVMADEPEGDAPSRD